jgi:hypothetical protein
MKSHLVSMAIASAMLAVAVLTYATPVLLAIAWYRRLRSHPSNGIRVKVGWLSLVLASLGFILLVVAIKVSPDPGSPAFEIWFAKWLKICSVVSSVALVASLVAVGKMQWAVRLSSAIPPLSMLVAKALESRAPGYGRIVGFTDISNQPANFPDCR